MLCRKTGDRSRDINDEIRTDDLTKLTQMKAPSLWIELVAEIKELDIEATSQIFGETLPAGLTLLK